MADLKYTVDIDTKGAQRNLGGLKTAVKGFIAVVAVDKIIDFGRAIVDATSQFQNFSNQLRLITNSNEEFENTLGKLTQAAKANRAAFGDTVDLFTKLTLATESLGKSEEEILNVTTKFQQALAISGADAGTAAGAIRQFGQAMASGTVRGDEFNSIVEALGPALSIMARESGINVGQLRQMSQAGDLTAETFFNMVSGSNAVTLAFQQMEPTIDQMETALSDAFDRALVKLGELTNATQGYENAIKRMTRLLDDFADAQGSLTDMAPGDIYKQARDGAISFDDAIYELGERIRNASLVDWIPFVGDDDAIAAMEGMLVQLHFLKMEQNKVAAETKALTEADTELATALNAVLAPHQKFIDQAKEFARADYRTELEKANQRVVDAEIVIEQLNLAFERSSGQIDNFVGLLRAAENELEAATGKVETLKEKSNELGEVEGFQKFYNNIIKGADAAAQEVEFTEQAIARLDEQLSEGKISVDTYAFAMDALTNSFDANKDKADELANKLKALSNETQNAVDAIDARIRQSEESAQLSGFEGIQRELKAIELEELRLADTVKARIRAQSEGLDATEIERQLARIDAATQTAITSRQAAARTIEANETRITQIQEARKQREKDEEERVKKAQSTFANGWKKAYEDYADNANNAGKQAERLFNKTTRSMEDAIVGFAKTGKFEFKDLVNTILEELLRSQIQRLIAQTFGSFGGGGGGGFNPFAGFFANGGLIPSGKFGVVGEKGPELISGPANITPMNGLGGGSQVIYNINAVDAPSFKAMIARDPGFIHAVAQQGARKVPVRR